MFNGRQESTKRTSWIANNVIPDSTIMNTICRSLVPLVDSKVREDSKNTFKILNTIKAVIKAFTAMDKAKLVIINGSKGRPESSSNWKKFTPIDPSSHLSILVHNATLEGNVKSFENWESDPSQVARDNKLKLAYRMKILDSVTDLCMRLSLMKEWWWNGFFDPTQSNNGISLKILVNKRMVHIGTFIISTMTHWAINSQQPLATVWIIARRYIDFRWNSPLRLSSGIINVENKILGVSYCITN